LVPVYAHKVSSKNPDVSGLSLTIKRPNPSRYKSGPFFYALPPNNQTNENSCVVSLYEYRRAGTGQHIYSTEQQLSDKDWIRMENPLCRVWKAPPDALFLDSKAKPIVRR